MDGALAHGMPETALHADSGDARGTTTGPSAGVGVLTAGLGVASTVAAVLFAGPAAMAVRRLGERPRAVGSP